MGTPADTHAKRPVERLYTPQSVASIDYARDLADPGQFPYTRGIHASGYRGKLWTMRQFAGFGTPEETNQRYRRLLEAGGTGLSVAFDLPTLMGDRDSLLQVVINLISNAIKFTERGEVTCRAYVTPEGVEISVTDTGIGIGPEDQARVFEKFIQVGDTLTDKPHGTGLGLPICREIVERHGGSIRVVSELGKGSSFYINLPRLSNEKAKELEAKAIANPQLDPVNTSVGA